MGFYSQIQNITSSISSRKYTNANPEETVTGLQETITHHDNSQNTLLQSMGTQGFTGNKNRVRPDWRMLAASSLTDMDVDDLEQALFLFALRKTQQADISELQSMWERYSPYSRRRMPAEAFRFVVEACQERLSGYDNRKP